MVPENHPVASQNRRAELLSRPMGVVPHTARAGDHKDTHRLEKSIGPKSCKDKIVERQQGRLSVVSDGREDLTVGVDERGSTDQVDHDHEGKGPEGSDQEGLENGNQHDLTDSSDELSRSVADSYGKPDPTAAAAHEDEQYGSNSEKDIANDLLVSSGRSGESERVEIGARDDSAIVQEEDSSCVQEKEGHDERTPDQDPGQTPQHEHENEGDDHCHSKG